MYTSLPGHISRSPYSMVQEAREIMTKMIIEMPRNKEKQVVELLNAASTYPNMSKYQLAMSRIILADLYFSHKVYGSAYEHYKLALEDYPKAPVKKKLAGLEKMKSANPYNFVFSLDANIVNTDICYQLPAKKDSVDVIFDPAWEKEIEERLSKLDELSRSEFYRLRTTRKSEGLLSIREQEELTLKAMEKSFAYRNT